MPALRTPMLRLIVSTFLRPPCAATQRRLCGLCVLKPPLWQAARLTQAIPTAESTICRSVRTAVEEW